mgnify:CR=1 FL=1
MPRGKSINRKQKEPDAVYKSRVVTKMINMVMQGGKKSLAERLIYTTLGNLNEDPKEARKFFEDAVKNVMPDMEVRSRRVGGANYQIPVPVKHDRSETLALRWIIDAAKAQKGADFVTILTRELKNAYGGEGSAVKKKVDTHRMADANRAFAHFRW